VDGAVILDQLVTVAAVRVDVPDGIGCAAVAEETHQGRGSFSLCCVEAVTTALGRARITSQMPIVTPRTAEKDRVSKDIHDDNRYLPCLHQLVAGWRLCEPFMLGNLMESLTKKTSYQSRSA